ncbi:MAG: hypothetical protein Q3961_03745 [Bifidobacteriaceae bacterium]|nr:hypothetical protein [Bifidobacteriaceae bacterium]
MQVLFPRGCAGCNMPDEIICEQCCEDFKQHTVRELPYPILVCGKFNEITRRIILRWKDHNDAACTSILALLCVQLLQMSNCLSLASRIIFVPVPSSKMALRKRFGRWHTKELAVYVAKLLRNQGYDARVEVLLRFSRAVKKSVTMRSSSRMNRLHNNIIVNTPKQYSSLQSVQYFVLDDVLTTGSTMQQCVKALKNNGINSVGLVIVST